MLILNFDIDWKKVRDISQKMDSDISLYLGLNIINELFDIQLPANIESKVNSSYIKSLTQDVYRFINNDLMNNESYMSYQQIKFFQSKLLDTYEKKFKHFVFNYISITKNDYLFFPLPVYLKWLYYFIKPFRIIFKIITK
jgi:hypothetical protein